VHKEFYRESIGERIFKIGPQLPKLLSNVKWLPFLGHSVQCWQGWVRLQQSLALQMFLFISGLVLIF